MLSISGEVRKVVDREYKDSKGKSVHQAVIVLEPSDSLQNHEVFLSASQLGAGVAHLWRNLIGQQASVSVSLYISHEHKFHKFNALGSGEPILTTSNTRNSNDVIQSGNTAT